MSSVKPSKQYRMRVVPYRPFRRFVFVFVLLIIVSLAVVGSFFAGHYCVVDNTGDIAAEHHRLRQEFNDKSAEAFELSQQVINLTLAAEVDHKASEEIQAKVVELKARVAELEQDNTFYRRLMRPTDGDKGLVIDPPAIISTDTNGVYRYNLLIKQVVTKHRQVTGFVEFDLLGKQDKKTRRIALKNISDAIDDEKIQLNFTYFQRIEGEMVLPKNFVPENLELKIVTQKPGKTIINKTFNWAVEES